MDRRRRRSVRCLEASPGAAPGGDPTGGGPLDLAFLTGESGNIEFAPLPVPILPPKDAP